MIAHGPTDARDPRGASPDNLVAASIRSAPAVGRPSSAAEGFGFAAGLAVAVGLGGLTLASLSSHRRAEAAEGQPAVAGQAAPAIPAGVVPVVAKVAPVAAAAATPTPAPAAGSALLVMDSTVAAPAAAAKPAAAGPAKSAVYFTQDEQFAARAGEEEVPSSHAFKLYNPARIIAQGTVIPAVLETALNSDLPGYARALVAQDVRGFDGSKVLIPRGSRLVGQYKSGLQTGQSRAMIVWTRLLRPDGLSVQLGSPAIDELGEAGLSGKVDRHSAQRFGAAILLSLVGGLASAAGGSSNTVVIGTAAEGSSAASVALQNQMKIPPTIRVPQGTPIQVFAARDLDFSVETP